MSALKDRLSNALEEARILAVLAEAILGFQYNSVFQKGFAGFSPVAQRLRLVSLALMLICMALVMTPAAYHRIGEEGDTSEGLSRFTSKVIGLALLPFALAIGIDMDLAAQRIGGGLAGVLCGLAMALLALFFWYGLAALHTRPRSAGRELLMVAEAGQRSGAEDTLLKDRIRLVLTEARLILPGVQVLLGFQFAIVLTESFQGLPASSRYVHLGSLSLGALSMILLMTPSAYHRLADHGEESEDFYRFACLVVTGVMVPIALAVCGDFFVVLERITSAPVLSLCLTLGMLALFYGLWFGLPLHHRRQRRRAEICRLDG